MQSTTPVWTDAEVPLEKVIALDQEQYTPIIILPVTFAEGEREIQAMCVRFQFTDEERAAIADGADLVVTELTFGQLFTPLKVNISKPNTYPY